MDHVPDNWNKVGIKVAPPQWNNQMILDFGVGNQSNSRSISLFPELNRLISLVLAVS
jgi:hypothetical protein